MSEGDEVILQNEDGQPLTEEEIASLLAQHQGGDGAEDGTAQIIDADGNAVTVTAEQMVAVGIDPNNMTEINEDQIQALLQLAQQGQTQQETVQHVVEERNVKPSVETKEGLGGTGQGVPAEHAIGPPEPTGPEEQPGELTMVIGDDGSLRLVDTTGTEFLLGPEQLATAGIDPANLTEENVQTIVQLAISAGASAGEPVGKRKQSSQMQRDPKRMRMNEIDPSQLTEVGEDGTLRLLDQNGQEIQVAVSDHVSSALPRGPGRSMSPAGPSRGRGGGRGFALIGQEVEVKKGGRAYNATIRYCRQGAGYKVQFDDGHFEWVSEDQVTLKSAKRASEAHLRESLSPVQGKTPNGIPSSMSSSLSRRVPPAIPGIRVSSQGESAHAKAHQAPNFFCPICENKVHQKEPAYIVIRLPACETCADSKILVLDQEGSQEDGEGEGPPAKSGDIDPINARKGPEELNSNSSQHLNVPEETIDTSLLVSS